jgi:hypothetical protein
MSLQSFSTIKAFVMEMLMLALEGIQSSFSSILSNSLLNLQTCLLIPKKKLVKFCMKVAYEVSFSTTLCMLNLEFL